MQPLSPDAEEFVPGLTSFSVQPNAYTSYQPYSCPEVDPNFLPQQWNWRTGASITPQTVCVSTFVPYEFGYNTVFTPYYYCSPVSTPHTVLTGTPYLNNHPDFRVSPGQLTSFNGDFLLHSLPSDASSLVHIPITNNQVQRIQTPPHHQTSNESLICDEYFFTVYFIGSDCYVNNGSASNEFLRELVAHRLSDIWSPPIWTNSQALELNSIVELTVDKYGCYQDDEIIQQSTNSVFDQIVNSTLSRYAETFSTQNCASTTVTDTPNNTRANAVVSNVPENKEPITLIWYGEKIADINEKLRSINDYIFVYADSDKAKCIGYIRSVHKEKIFLVLSNVCERDILSGIQPDETQSLPRQIDSIFIYRTNGKNELSTISSQHYRKVIDIFDSEINLLDSIMQNKKMVEKQTAALSLYNINKRYLRNLAKESTDYQWTELITGILIKIPSSNDAKKQMVDKCRDYYRGNKNVLKNIDEFEKTYTTKDAIKWYTRQDFVYKLVNKALYTEDPDGLILFRFYVSDLCRQLQTEHDAFVRTLTCPYLRVYRGIKAATIDMNEIAQLASQLVSTSSFLSTTRSKKVAEMYADVGSSSNRCSEKVSMIYVIQVDVRIRSIIFADISKQSEMTDEAEVLFAPGAVFRLASVHYIESHSYWLIRMTAVDKETIARTDHIEKYAHWFTSKNQEKISLGLVLLNMNEGKKAQAYLENLLQHHKFNKSDRATIYNLLACALDQQYRSDKLGSEQTRKQLESTILEYILTSYRLCVETGDVSGSELALQNIIIDHLRQKDYDRAMSYSIMALRMKQKLYPNMPHMHVNELEQIARVYYNKGDLSQALHYYEYILRLRRRHLTDEQHEIAVTLMTLGDLNCMYTFKYIESSKYYLDALDISESLKDLELKINALSKLSKLYLNDLRNTTLALMYKFEQINEQKKILQSGDSNIAECLVDISAIVLKQNRQRNLRDDDHVESAVKYAVEGLNALKKSCKATPAQIVRLLRRIASLYNYEHKWTKTETYLLEAFQLCETAKLHDELKEDILEQLIEVCHRSGNISLELYEAKIEDLINKQIMQPNGETKPSITLKKLDERINSKSLNKNDISMLLMLSESVNLKEEKKTVHNKHKFIRNQLQNTTLTGDNLSCYVERQQEEFKYYTKHPFEQPHISKSEQEQQQQRHDTLDREHAPSRQRHGRTLGSSLMNVMCLCDPTLLQNLQGGNVNQVTTMDDIWRELSNDLRFFISNAKEQIDIVDPHIYVADTRGALRRHHIERVKRRQSQKIGNRPPPAQQIRNISPSTLIQWNDYQSSKKQKNIYPAGYFRRVVSSLTENGNNKKHKSHRLRFLQNIEGSEYDADSVLDALPSISSEMSPTDFDISFTKNKTSLASFTETMLEYRKYLETFLERFSILSQTFIQKRKKFETNFSDQTLNQGHDTFTRRFFPLVLTPDEAHSVGMLSISSPSFYSLRCDKGVERELVCHIDMNMSCTPIMQNKNAKENQHFRRPHKERRKNTSGNWNFPMRQSKVKQNFNYFRSRRLC